MSSLTRQRLRTWQLYLETSLALMDVLEADFDSEIGLAARYYDVLVKLEDAPDGLRMNELAEKILYSKSGLTRVVDNMEKAGLIRRHRPEDDRRSIFVLLTPKGANAKDRARAINHEWIKRNFSDLLDDADIESLTRAIGKLAANARTRRPGRVSG
jgi:DNA-binding MarR family transcriptional regulator